MGFSREYYRPRSQTLMTRPGITLIALLAVFAVIEGALTVTRPIGFFNVIAGGRSQGDKWMLGSSLDWGQDMHLIVDWKRGNAEKRPLYLYSATSPTDTLAIGLETDGEFFAPLCVDGDELSIPKPVSGYLVVSRQLYLYPRYWFCHSDHELIGTIGDCYVVLKL